MKRKSVSFLAMSLAAVMSLSDAVVVAAAPAEELPMLDEGEYDGEPVENDADVENYGSDEGEDAPEKTGTDQTEETANVTFPTAEEIAKGAVIAPLQDHKESEPKTKLYDDGSYRVTASPIEDEPASYQIKVMARNLQYHANNGGKVGYWAGIGLPVQEGYSVIYHNLLSDEEATAVSTETFEKDGEKYDALYFDVKGSELIGKKAYVSAEYSKGEQTETRVFVIDFSQVTIVTSTPSAAKVAEGIKKADPVDNAEGEAKKTGENLVKNFAVSEAQAEGNEIDVSLTADYLAWHKCGSELAGKDGYGFWAGVAIPKIEGMNVSYKQSYKEINTAVQYDSMPDNQLFDGEKATHDTFYFNVKDARLVNKTGYVYVQYSDPDNASDVVSYVIKVDLSGVACKDNTPDLSTVVEGITVAPQVDADGKITSISDNYEISDAIVDDADTATIKVRAENLVKHSNGNPDPEANKYGYWAGIAIPVQNGVTTEYCQSYVKLEDPSKAEFVGHGDSVLYKKDDEGKDTGEKTHDTIYFNALNFAGKTDPGYIYVRYMDEDGTSVIKTLKVDFSLVTLKSEIPASSVISDAIGAAILTDDSKNLEDDEIISDYGIDSVEPEADGSDAYLVRVSGQNLAYHKNADRGYGYWAGVAFPAQKDVKTEYFVSAKAMTESELEKADFDEAEPATENGRMDNFYFDLTDEATADKPEYIYVRYSSQLDERENVTYAYKIDLSGVSIAKMVTGLKVDRDRVSMPAPGEEQTTATVNIIADPENAKVKYYVQSSNKDVANAKVEGDIVNITASNKGTTDITITELISGKTARMTAIVGGEYKQVAGISINQATLELGAGKTGNLSYEPTSDDYTDTEFVWESSDVQVASVDRFGVVTAHGAGTADIIIKAMHDGDVVVDEDGKEIAAKCQLTVRPYASEIVVNHNGLILDAPLSVKGEITGEEMKLTAKVLEDNALCGDVTWSVSDESIAKIDKTTGPEITVTALKAGQATITATVNNLDDMGSVTKEIIVKVIDMINSYDIGNYEQDEVWFGNLSDATYTGSKLTPAFDVYYDTMLLIPNVDYTVTYKNNINAYKVDGTKYGPNSDSKELDPKAPTATVKLKGNYNGSKSVNFDIAPLNLSEVSVNNVSALTKQKKGENVEQKLKPSVTYNGKTLKLDKDYSINYFETAANAYKDAGNWNVMIEGTKDGNFTGSKAAQVCLVDKKAATNIAKQSVSLEQKSVAYTGKPIEVKVKAGDLIEGTDYTVTYANNVNVGTATVTITGAGKVTDANGKEHETYGTKKLTFKITNNPISLKSADIMASIEGNDVRLMNGKSLDDKPVLTYAKGGVKPQTVVYDEDGNSLTSSDVSISNKVNLKKKVGTITIKGKGNYYKDSVTVEYTIGERSLADLTVVADDFTYSDKANAYQKNKITVYDIDGKVLKEKKDYVIKWGDNKSVPSAGETVNASIVAVENGFYKDSQPVSFKIVSKSATKMNSLKGMIADQEYKGSEITLTNGDIELHTKDGQKVIASDYEIEGYVNNVNTGKATAIIRGTGTNYSGIKLITFNIVQREVK